MNGIPATDTIESLDELLNIMWRLRGLKGLSNKPLKYSGNEVAFVQALQTSRYRKRGKYLDLWFRGERNINYSLAPGAFRAKEIGKEKEETFYEETSATFHFMLRRPEYRSQCKSDFEWLSLFQHYGGLTRLLDWSENATVGAFFAVEKNENDDDKDGSLYILNAALLNEETALTMHDIPSESTGVTATSAENHGGIFIDTSPDVVLRAAHAFCRTDYEWRSRIDSILHSGHRAEMRWLAATLSLLDECSKSISGNSSGNARNDLSKVLREKLAYPIAVFPYRSNNRLVAQAGMFTLHGGKGRVSITRQAELIPNPKPIEELASQNANKWLLRYEIPMKAKPIIREQLQAIGVHYSTLFPEIQSDGKIMKDLWCQ